MPGAMFLTRERSKSLIREVAALSRNPYLYSPLQSFSVLVANFYVTLLNDSLSDFTQKIMYSTILKAN